MIITHEELLLALAELADVDVLPGRPGAPLNMLIRWHETPREWAERVGIDEGTMIDVVESFVGGDAREVAGLFMLGWECSARSRRARE